MPLDGSPPGCSDVENGTLAYRQGNGIDSSRRNFQRRDTFFSIARHNLRGKEDDLPQNWWFASTAVPLIAATFGPLANVLSIAALVTPWRVSLPNNGQLPEGTDDNGIGIKDPRWEIILNAISLGCGFAGNLLLLLHFVGRVGYIIALPFAINFWLLASGILIAITSCMSIYAGPIGPGEIWSQGFWHAVIACITYLICALLLVANIVGYLRGHYPQNFDLDDDQRTLILQTMMMMIWLAGGAGVFSRLEGFGDLSPTTDGARGFLMAYVLIGIIFLGLVITSITRFVANISKDKVIKQHQQRRRQNTYGRTVTNERELRERLGLPPRRKESGGSRLESLASYGKIKRVGRTITFKKEVKPPVNLPRSRSQDAILRARARTLANISMRPARRQKLLLLEEEKDRFVAMRKIQRETRRFKQYLSLGFAFIVFAVLWCLGAVVFMLGEQRLQKLSYFDSLYFSFVSLLTIGYGDVRPRSNVSKPFFIVWSLIAVPALTVLIQQMSRTVMTSVNRGTVTVADWTILPKKGVVSNFLDSRPALRDWLAGFAERRQEKKRVKEGFQVQDPDVATEVANDDASVLESRIESETRALETTHDLARQLSAAIKRVAQDLRADRRMKYSYEDWVHFTKLIRFSAARVSKGAAAAMAAVEEREHEEGLVEWDWIGEDSPLLADVSESEWVLDRLCESLDRYTRRDEAMHHRTRKRLESESRSAIREGDEEDATMKGANGSSTPADEEIREWAEKMGSADAESPRGRERAEEVDRVAGDGKHDRSIRSQSPPPRR